MNEKNMTALVSCFSRSYHCRHNRFPVFKDDVAEKLLTQQEHDSIACNMSAGISFFNPDFKGTEDEALRWIVDNQLSPSVLARSAFCEASLKTALLSGCRQYIILASGYDTFAWRNTEGDISVFELDRPEVIEDKQKRLEAAELDPSKAEFIKCDFTDPGWSEALFSSSCDMSRLTFCSMLGISYYLTKNEFCSMLGALSTQLCDGSSLVFDYPAICGSKETDINEQLAKGADEEMKSKYSYDEIETALSAAGFLIYEHLDASELTKNFFTSYNAVNPQHKLHAPEGVCCCLAVKNGL